MSLVLPVKKKKKTKKRILVYTNTRITLAESNWGAEAHCLRSSRSKISDFRDRNDVISFRLHKDLAVQCRVC
jgi:hypothetical protein